MEGFKSPEVVGPKSWLSRSEDTSKFLERGRETNIYEMIAVDVVQCNKSGN